MIIHKIIPSVDNNQWLKRIETQMNPNLIKVPKVLSQRISTRYYKTIETNKIHSPMCPPWYF